MNVVVVESPAKAKTINKYLGKDFIVLPSFGHVRDLPAKDGSVLPDNDFEMLWEVEKDGARRVADIAKALKGADRLFLATDPDREGEAISWHVLEILKAKGALKGVNVKRVVFNEITKQAVANGIANPRDLDQELVDAYLARRALDYLVGFNLSPVLWRKLPSARSAGRVQSVALRLVCERELEIEAFRSREYWSVIARLEVARGGFEARLVALDGRKLDRFDLGDAGSANAAAERVRTATLAINSVEAKAVQRHPAPPFTTSTLQQEAARKLGFSASRTMQVAQRLYEGMEIDGETTGLITYMRTDGVAMANEAIGQARALIGREHGDRYVPERPRVYKAKARNAQEAHEAIRPTDFFRNPAQMARRLEGDQLRLYDLIWKRALASQMASADLERTTIEIGSADGGVGLRASGTVVKFDGFLTLYQEGRDDEESEDGGRLPAVTSGEGAKATEVVPEQHFTEPPPRYSEASLVKKLEELGIGRPSTYASILSVLRDRSYVRMDKNRFIPEDKGRLVTVFLENFFGRYVQYDFTAGLEEQLDEVSAGKADWRAVLRAFWTDFSAAIEGTRELRVSEVLDAIDRVLGPHVFPERTDGTDPRKCPTCQGGRLSLKLGKFGAFVGCSNYPECRYTRPFAQNADDGGTPAETERLLGEDPANGAQVWAKIGRFGPYLESAAPGAEKPRRSSLPKEIPFEAVDLARALALLALPREVGLHPETGKPILAGLGRYGPYLLHDGKYTRLQSAEDALSIGENRAVTLIAEQPEKRGRRTAEPLKNLGPHPRTGTNVLVMAGRYGPYVACDGVNATLPKDADPESLDMTGALALLDDRAGKTPKAKARSGPTRSAAKPKPKARAKAATGAAADTKAGKAGPSEGEASAKAAPRAAKAAAKKTPAKKTPAKKAPAGKAAAKGRTARQVTGDA